MKYILAVLFVAGFLACNNADQKAGNGIKAGGLSQAEIEKSSKDTANYTTIQWLDSTTQNLGRAKEGQIVEVSYRFKNTGSTNLIIEDVRPGCGCTVPEKPERPIAPGEEEVIKAKFDSHDRKGMQEKYINVVANTKPEKTTVLTFKIEITE